MKFFSLINGDKKITPNSKVISKEEFALALSCDELLETTKQDITEYRKKIEQECIAIKEAAKKNGFDEGMSLWSAQIAAMEKEIKKLRMEIQASIVPLAVASIKKIIGQELSQSPDAVVSVILTALKESAQNKRVTIMVNPSDLETIELAKPKIKTLLEYVEVLKIQSNSDISKGGCVIETETGIVNAQIENQIQKLEEAFADLISSQGIEDNSKTAENASSSQKPE